MSIKEIVDFKLKYVFILSDVFVHWSKPRLTLRITKKLIKKNKINGYIKRNTDGNINIHLDWQMSQIEQFKLLKMDIGLSSQPKPHRGVSLVKILFVCHLIQCYYYNR